VEIWGTFILESDDVNSSFIHYLLELKYFHSLCVRVTTRTVPGEQLELVSVLPWGQSDSKCHSESGLSFHLYPGGRHGECLLV
jgi:hypothetical protein